MLHPSIAVGVILFASGCVTLPTHQRLEAVPARGTADEAFGCAMREVNERRYEVIAADRASGFLRARRVTTGLADAVAQMSTSDIVTVTVYPSATGTPTVRAVATGETTHDGDASPRQGSASAQGHDDARALLAVCGTVS